MTSPLESLCGPGKSLRAEPPNPTEYEGLKRSGLARLGDADPEVRHHVLEALLHRRPRVGPDERPALEAAIRDGAPPVRGAAFTAAAPWVESDAWVRTCLMAMPVMTSMPSSRARRTQ